MYYQRQAEYEPKTKARGEDVRNELESVMAGFALLPAPNSKGSGFDSTFIVQPVTGAYSPIFYQMWQTWPETINAHGHSLYGLDDFADEMFEAQQAAEEGEPYTPIRLDDPTAITSSGYVDYCTFNMEPLVNPTDSTVISCQAKGGETVLDTYRQSHARLLFINGVLQDPATYSMIGNRYIQLDTALLETDRASMAMGQYAPPSVTPLVFAQPFALSLYNSSGFYANFPLLTARMPVPVNFPAGNDDAACSCSAPPQKLLVINIFKNDKEVGLISISPGSLTGLLTWTEQASYQAGDVIKIITHSEPEPDIQGLTILLKGKRIL